MEGSRASDPTGYRPGKQRSEKRVEQRREGMLRAALQVFGRRGYHPAQMEEIAQAAGVGKGTLYHHFESKEALLRAAIAYLFDLHNQALDTTLAQTDDAIEKLWRIVRTDYAFIQANRRFVQVIFTEATGLGHSASFRANMLAAHRQEQERIAVVIRAGQAAGRLRADVPADFLASIFRGVVRELTWELVFGEGVEHDAESVAQRVMDVFLRGAGAPRGELTDTERYTAGEGTCRPD